MVTDELLREELAGVAPTEKNAASYMACFLALGGDLSIGSAPKLTVSLKRTQSAFVLAQCLHVLYGYRPEIALGAEEKRAKRMTVELPETITRKVLADCRMTHTDEAGNCVYTLGLESMRWVDKPAFFAALYWECGRLYTTDNYRLDLVASADAKRRKEWESMLRAKKIKCIVSETEDKVRLSMRNEAVAAFMALIGASECSLQVTDYYVERDVNRSVNRAVNCSTSNMDKTFKAAAYQLWAIELLQQKGLYNLLSREVRVVGDMRLQYPDSSMQQLAQLVEINKTAVYRRMKVITDTAEAHKGE